jgi:gliding motility-associated-like protein
MTILFRFRALLLLLLFPIVSFGFDLSVIHTNETCPGNGSLSFTVSNTNPNGSIVFIIYKLPDVTTPYASGTDTTLNGLTAGGYRIIARETVGNSTTTQQQDVTITSSFEPLTYSVQALNQACSSTSSISIIVTSGIAATYAVFEGPILFAPQASNTFSGLPVGIYKVRVIDSCGNSVVQTFTVTLNPTGLTIGTTDFTAANPPSCTSVLANNTISAATGTVIGYPLQIHYILHLPSGDNHIQTTLNSGNPTVQTISLTIPHQVNQNYSYDLIITDACGTTYPTTSFVVNNDITLNADVVHLPCNQFYFSLNTDNFVSSYTLNFISFPVGFNPAAFNILYPGPYNQSKVDFGNTTIAVPFGDYTVAVTDTCGKTTTITFSVVDIPPVPSIVGTNNGCLSNNGNIEASIPGYIITSAIITAAPSGYPFSLPHTVNSSITSEGILVLNPLPLGDYTIQLTDNCGDVINPLNVTIPAYINQGITIEQSPGCDSNKASIKITSNNGSLTSVAITIAPSAFPFPLPYDISTNIISTGELYLAGLPTGDYTFRATDACSFVSTKSAVVDGYLITGGTFSLIANCGSFNIPLDIIDNINGVERFGLQKLLDSATDTWGHPVTEEVYANGTAPNDNNSYLLQNNATNFNLTFNGVFRIVHYFSSYNNGSEINSGLVASPTKSCIEILSPSLTFNNALSINDVSRVPCSATGNLDVILFANGTPPLHYRITEKDGIPFIVDNGNSNVFLNITPGIYKFEVEDSCGNTVNRNFDVSDLASLVTIYSVCDMFSCATTITGNETFDLSSQTPNILGDQSQTDYTLSYHTSQSNAENNINPILNLTNFNPSSNPQTIYIRLVFNQLPNCYETASFNLITGQTPTINLAPEYVVCNTEPILLDASGGNLPDTSYSWSNGSAEPSISISSIGITTVRVTATNSYGSCNDAPLACTTQKDITVTIAQLPEIDRIESEDWTDEENSITIFTTQSGEFEYSLDGINFQTDATFTNLTPGLYTVFVRDVNGCKTVTEEVWLLNYPKFFTPNDDGYNDRWYVKNAENEPDLKIYIFDRYGKLITNIISNSPGWDGKLNGKLLFADDYWFEAHRQDGRVLRGHFALKR